MFPEQAAREAIDELLRKAAGIIEPGKRGTALAEFATRFGQSAMAEADRAHRNQNFPASRQAKCRGTSIPDPLATVLTGTNPGSIAGTDAPEPM